MSPSLTELPDYLEDLWLQHHGTALLRTPHDVRDMLAIDPDDLVKFCETIALRSASSGVSLAKQRILAALDNLIGEADGQPAPTNH